MQSLHKDITRLGQSTDQGGFNYCVLLEVARYTRYKTFETVKL